MVHLVSFDHGLLEPSFLKTYHSSSLRWVLIQRFLSSLVSPLRDSPPYVYPSTQFVSTWIHSPYPPSPLTSTIQPSSTTLTFYSVDLSSFHFLPGPHSSSRLLSSLSHHSSSPHLNLSTDPKPNRSLDQLYRTYSAFRRVSMLSPPPLDSSLNSILSSDPTNATDTSTSSSHSRRISSVQPLAPLSSLFDNYLFIDVRDSFFQRDPFADLPPPASPTSSSVPSSSFSGPSPKMFAMSEPVTGSISKCGWNKGWISDCFGERLLNLLLPLPISCSGVTIGGRDPMLRYSSLMSQILQGRGVFGGDGDSETFFSFSDHSKNSSSSPSEGVLFPVSHLFEGQLGRGPGRFPTCERNGVDQGIHNVLLHLGLVSGFELREEYQSPATILNLQASTALRDYKADTFGIVFDLEEGRVFQPPKLNPISSSNANWVSLNTNQLNSIQMQSLLSTTSQKSLFSIVHQYDRHSKLQRSVTGRYIPSLALNLSNPLFGWNQACGVNPSSHPSSSLFSNLFSSASSSSTIDEMDDSSPSTPASHFFVPLVGTDYFFGHFDGPSQRALLASDCCSLCLSFALGQSQSTPSSAGSLKPRPASRSGGSPAFLPSSLASGCSGFTFNDGVCYFKKDIYPGDQARYLSVASPSLLSSLPVPPLPLTRSTGSGSSSSSIVLTPKASSSELVSALLMQLN